MPFPTSLLRDSEEIVLDQHPHWWYLAPRGAALAAALLVGVLVATNTNNGILSTAMSLLILGVLGWFLIRLATWRTTSFTITTDRCIWRTGLVAKQGIEIPLERVNTVRFNQSVFERMLRSGDITIESASEHGTQSFADIANPTHVHKTIYDQMENNEQRGYERLGATINAARSDGDARSLTVEEQLEKLAKLRADGVVTESEFQVRKTQILGG